MVHLIVFVFITGVGVGFLADTAMGKLMDKVAEVFGEEDGEFSLGKGQE